MIDAEAARATHDLAARGIYVGTASWTDPTLVEAGTFYPSPDMTAEERLRFYAEHFPLVEVDATYYAPPSERVAGLWVERTPDDFVFDVKAFRLFTQHPTPPGSLWRDLRDALPEDLHEKRNVYLRDLPDELRNEAALRFIEALLPLHSAGKLGAVLFQLPPWVFPGHASREYLQWVAETFAEYRVAVEFRVRRWMDEDHAVQTLSLLESLGLAYVCVDEPQGFPTSVPPVVAATTDLGIVRFHGRNRDTWAKRDVPPAEKYKYLYSEEELAPWAQRIADLAASTRAVHAVFNNCYADFGIRNGLQLARLLAAARSAPMDTTDPSDTNDSEEPA